MWHCIQVLLKNIKVLNKRNTISCSRMTRLSIENKSLFSKLSHRFYKILMKIASEACVWENVCTCMYTGAFVGIRNTIWTTWFSSVLGWDYSQLLFLKNTRKSGMWWRNIFYRIKETEESPDVYPPIYTTFVSNLGTTGQCERPWAGQLLRRPWAGKLL